MTQIVSFHQTITNRPSKIGFSFVEKSAIITSQFKSTIAELIDQTNFSESWGKTEWSRNLSKNIANRTAVSNVVCFIFNEPLFLSIRAQDEEKKNIWFQD